MTYNFDPDRWYDNELAFLDHRLKTDRMTPEQYDEARQAAWLHATCAFLPTPFSRVSFFRVFGFAL